MLAFGTSPITYGSCSVQDAVAMYLKMGVRHLDVAMSYGTEREVGEAIRASGVPRSHLFVAAKIEGPVGYDRAIEQLLKHDLPTIGLEYFDLLLMHFPCPNGADFPDKCGPQGNMERLDTWRGMEHLRAIGKARALGVSNFNMAQLGQLYRAGYHPAVNQVQWHLGYHNDALLRGATAGGTHIEAWASLASPVVGGYGMVAPGVSLGDPRLRELAAKYNASTAQVAFQWMVKLGVSPVTGTCIRSHADEDLGSFSGFELSGADMSYLNELSVRPAHALAAVHTPSVTAATPAIALLSAVALLEALFAAATRRSRREENAYISLA
jgi:diketogulonate reductase-like aldo/keto reductase